MIRELLSRWLGTDVLCSEITDLSGQVLALEDELSATQRMNQSLTDTMRMLLEPNRDDACQKVRLRDKDEAAAFGRHVETANGTPAGTLEPYKCRDCPRQPVTLAYFWHVRHVNRTKRGLGAKQYATTRPREMGRITPENIARLKGKVA